MSQTETIKVPDIGDFDEVPVIEILVGEGDEIEPEQSLIALESDKATMEVPSPRKGKVVKVLVALGDKVAQGTPILELKVEQDAADESDSKPAEKKAGDTATKAPPASPAKAAASDREAPTTTEQVSRTSGGKQPASRPAAEERGEGDIRCDVVVLGSGPGGYTAAFRAADLGLDTVLIERYPSLGGVCLNVGCIPSKALLHTAEVITEVAAIAQHGVSFGEPKIDLDKLRGWKEDVVGKLTGGLAKMAKQRGVRVVQGVGRFLDSHRIEVDGDDGTTTVGFARAIIAAGSQAIKLPGLPWDDPRVMDSTDALEIEEVPKRLLVIGGGIIGMEMASVYYALGSKVTVVEMLDQLMPGADPDLVKPFHRFVGKRYENIFLKSKVTGVEAQKKGLKVSFEGDKTPDHDTFDRVLVAVGRTPNGNRIGADRAGVKVTERGYIPVDQQMRTNIDNIFAIGDIVGAPMLAHKATHEAKVAAEVCAGEKSVFDARVIPAVAYTDPEVAWVGVTEAEAKEQGLDYRTGSFPWAASGRALGLGRGEGMTKLIFDDASERLIGAGIVGPHAGDLIAECTLAIEMGCEAADIGLTIHPHPTLSETIAFSAEAFEGTITDLYLGKKRG